MKNLGVTPLFSYLSSTSNWSLKLIDNDHQSDLLDTANISLEVISRFSLHRLLSKIYFISIWRRFFKKKYVLHLFNHELNLNFSKIWQILFFTFLANSFPESEPSLNLNASYPCVAKASCRRHNQTLGRERLKIIRLILIE